MQPILTRRRLLGLSGGSLLGGFLLGPRVGRSAHRRPDDETGWRQPRADSRNVAWTTDPGPGSDGWLGWEYRVGEFRRFEHAGLALADGTLLVPAHRSLRGIDLESGTERWRYAHRRSPPIGDRDRAQLDTVPRVRGSVAYLAFGSSVCALDCRSQQLRWRYDLNSSSDGLHLFGNTVYVAALIDGDDRLVAIDAETGLERWRRSGRASPMAATDGLLVGARSDDGRLVGFEPDTGRRRWQSDVPVSGGSLSRGAVVAVDDLVVSIDASGELIALDAETGERRWTVADDADDPSTYLRSLAVDPSERALYWSRPGAGRIDRIDLEGETGWRTDDASLEFGVSAGAETVYASTTDGLLALATDTGDERFRISVDGVESDPFGSTPLIAGDRVYHLLGETVYEVGPQ